MDGQSEARRQPLPKITLRPSSASGGPASVVVAPSTSSSSTSSAAASPAQPKKATLSRSSSAESINSLSRQGSKHVIPPQRQPFGAAPALPTDLNAACEILQAQVTYAQEESNTLAAAIHRATREIEDNELVRESLLETYCTLASIEKFR